MYADSKEAGTLVQVFKRHHSSKGVQFDGAHTLIAEIRDIDSIDFKPQENRTDLTQLASSKYGITILVGNTEPIISTVTTPQNV